MTFGLTADGFTPKPLNEAKLELENQLVNAFGEDINLEPSSVFGQLVGINSEAVADLWAELLKVYWSQYPDTASELALDLICAINNITRRPATATQATALLTGLDTTVIPLGSVANDTVNTRPYALASTVTLAKETATTARVTVATVGAGDYTVTINSTPYTYTFVTDNTVGDIIAGLQTLLNAITSLSAATISEGINLAHATLGSTFNIAVTSNLTLVSVGTVGQFVAQQADNTPLPVGALSEISTPVAGWLAITNPASGITGQRREADESLRLRRRRARDNDLLGALENLSGVVAARTVFNEGTATNGDGVPRQHLWAIVEGGLPADIVATIAQFKPAGIGTFGTQSAVVTSTITGETATYSFERPTYVNPAIVVTYTITGDFPDDGEAMIEQALVDYGATLTIGDSLFYSRLFTPINTVQGMTFTLTVNAGTANVVAGTDDRIRLLASNITVTEAS